MTKTYRYSATDKGRDAYSKHTFMFTHLLKLDQHIMDILMDAPEGTHLGVKGITNRVRESYTQESCATEPNIATTLEMLAKEGMVARHQQ